MPIRAISPISVSSRGSAASDQLVGLRRMAFSIQTLRQANAKRWTEAKLTRSSEYRGTSQYPGPVPRILAAQNRYERVQAMTGVDWRFVACTHYRESNLNFNTQLGQGDPLHSVSTHAPEGRGPFNSFEDGAYDALVNCGPYAARIKDWSLPGMLTVLEMYNGLKYAYAGVPSPYIWSGTDQYTIGKVMRDHGPIEQVVDKQLGVAGIILQLPSKASEKPVEPITPLPAPTLPVPSKKPLPEAPKPNTGPILNKEGEDISTYLHELGHEVWEWLRRH